MAKSKREKLLEDALKAVEDLIGWYEMEHDRGTYDDDDLPEDFVELEDAFDKAKQKLK